MLLAAKLARWGDRLLTLAAALLLGALALFGAWSLWDIAATRRAALPEQTLRFKPLAAAPADSPGFAELRALNPDVCGWLTLDGTRIDFPVVQGADNMVYVNTDVYGDFSLSGAIFLDSRCPADFTAPYSIVYGHHIEDGGMFGDIVQFTQSDYFAATHHGHTDNRRYSVQYRAVRLRAGRCLRPRALRPRPKPGRTAGLHQGARGAVPHAGQRAGGGLFHLHRGRYQRPGAAVRPAAAPNVKGGNKDE